MEQPVPGFTAKKYYRPKTRVMAKRKWGSDDEMEYHQISRGYDGSITPDGWRDYNGELVECTLETGKVVKGLLRAKGNSEKIRLSEVILYVGLVTNLQNVCIHPHWNRKPSLTPCCRVTVYCALPLLAVGRLPQCLVLPKPCNEAICQIIGIQGQFLMLTYSAKLKEDSRQRVGLHKLENLTVHSYHSFYHLSKEYPCKNDKQMKDILANDNQLRRIWDFEERSGVKRGNALELLVLDEQQDCTPLFFVAINKIVDMCHPKQMLVIGDKKQEINAFKGADHRFLTLADKLYPDTIGHVS